MRATETLKQEHRVIERMLRVLFVASQKIQRGEEPDPRLFRQAVDFIRNYADKSHHMKEEDNLFPTMANQGVPKEGGPIGMMLIEHDEGRAHVRSLDEALDKYEAGDKSPAVKNAIAGHALGYAQLLSQHIQKEDDILYAIADDVLSDVDQRNLSAKFEDIDNNTFGREHHERYEKMVGELERSVQAQGSGPRFRS